MPESPRIPERDLVADLANLPDPEWGDDGNVCRALPRHLRLYVAGWMLSDGTPEGDVRGLAAAKQLYELCGAPLLDRRGVLTTADVVAEVLQLVLRARSARSRAPRHGVRGEETQRRAKT